jgi:hypothetical protein
MREGRAVMSFAYYYRDAMEAGEIILQATDTGISLRITEDDGMTTSMIKLPEEEIDLMIKGLKEVKEMELLRKKRQRVL